MAISRKFSATGTACVAILLSLGASALDRASAQSYNCRYARSADEVLICQDGGLAALDERMSALYFSLRNRLAGPDSGRLEDTRHYWLSERKMCGRDAGCIRDVYQGWIADMERLGY